MSVDGWVPVAASADVPSGYVYQTMLDSEPLAIWRDASGRVNIWRDRCPHRGVRFSVGIAMDDELRCQYHAWRFASGSGRCTFIPAHPGNRPAATIRATVWPVAEEGGLVWTGTAPETPPSIASGEVLRAMPVHLGAVTVEAALVTEVLPGTTLFVQPVAAGHCVIRGLVDDPAALASIDAALERLRRRLESAAC